MSVKKRKIYLQRRVSLSFYANIFYTLFNLLGDLMLFAQYYQATVGCFSELVDLICEFKYLLFSPQAKVYGKDRVKFMESMIVGDIAELQDNQVRHAQKVQNMSCQCESLTPN